MLLSKRLNSYFINSLKKFFFFLYFWSTEVISRERSQCKATEVRKFKADTILTSKFLCSCLVKLTCKVIQLTFVHVSSPFPTSCRPYSSCQKDYSPLHEQRAICKQVSALSKKTSSCQSLFTFSSILAELPFS